MCIRDSVISESYTLPHKPRKRREVKAIKEPVVPRIHEQYELPRMKQFAEPKFNPEMFVQDLSLKDARAVYEVLKGYFSG